VLTNINNYSFTDVFSDELKKKLE